MSKYVPYPIYKETGVEWFGKVPAHWEVKKIAHMTPVKRGASPRPIDDPRYFDDAGEFGWVRIQDVTACGGRLTSTRQHLSPLGTGKSVKMQPGQLFLSIAATVGIPCITGMKCCIHDGFVYFPNLKTSPHWLYRIFESKECFVGLGKMGTQLNLNTETVGNIFVPVPPQEEQTSINEALDRETARIDALIEKKTRFIELLKEKRQALITQAVTKGLDPTVPMKDSGVEWIGEVPAHWEVKRLRFVVNGMKAGPFGSALTKNMYTQSGYRVYGQEQVIPADFSIGDYFISEETFTAMRQYEVNEGNVLVSCVGTFGKIAVFPKGAQKGIINPRLIRMRPRAGVIPGYLELVLKSQVVFQQMVATSRGGTMDVVNIGILSELWIPLPNETEQREVLEATRKASSRIDRITAKTEQSVGLLKERRSALITAAVTGQIDLREEE